MRILASGTRGNILVHSKGSGMEGIAQVSFGAANFGTVELGDRRRTRRLVELADAMCRHPGGTLPDKLSEPRELRAFYRIVRAAEVTHEKIMQGHYAATRATIEQATGTGAVVLIIHDATEIDYTKIRALSAQLGQIGQGTQRGYICHNSLAVRGETREVIGLTSQILHRRADVPENETLLESRERANRESRLWVEGAKRSGLAAQPGVVDVSDSLSDTYEYMCYEFAQQRCFLLRSREDRRLHVPINGHHLLYAGVRSWRARDSDEIEVHGTDKRPSRKATVNLSFGAVTLGPPGKRLGDYEPRPLPVWCVRVWEPDPPAGETAVEWILVTNVPVTRLAEARQRVHWYGTRFVIEDYHKAMKTGCGIETMQFDTTDRLEPALGVLSILATTLMKLRDAARQPNAETRPATEVVDVTYVEVLRRQYPQRLGKQPTVLQFYMHVARLGGHQNRKVDGFPGWITLWRGWMKLESMVAGYRLARSPGKT